MTTMSIDLTSRLACAEATARRAGALAREYFLARDRLIIETKRHPGDLVTEADRAVERLIRAEIADAFPEDALLGEEHGTTPGTSGLTWAIDPIDGTAPFLAGLFGWCVSIGAYDAHGPAIGVIYAPMTEELFTAARGAGAALNGTQLVPRPGNGPKSGLLGVGSNDRVPAAKVADMLEALITAGIDWVRYGSGALMLAYVAAGRLIGYVEPRMCVWDCMAGYCLVEAAGGRTLPFDGGAEMRDAAPVLGARSEVFDKLLHLCRLDDAGFWSGKVVSAIG